MSTSNMLLNNHKIALVIPAYRVEKQIAGVLKQVPDYITLIIVVDDFSPDHTAEIVTTMAEKDSRIILIRHTQNQGVGGATLSGMLKAQELGMQIAIKVDGDGQMDMVYIPNLVQPLIAGVADYAKGNRFRDLTSLRKMPVIRRLGNTVLSFWAKIATGYWTCFDPTNGFIALRLELLSQLPIEKIDKRYYFEISMLSHLYLINACIRDVPMPAIYGNETSNLSINRVSIEFPLKMTGTLLRRIILKYFIYDFSMASIYLLGGVPLLLFGIIFGFSKWVKYAQLGLPAPTGTVMLPTLAVILGIQFIIAAINIDLNESPSQPISQSLSK
jgi:dolichol-phosphate mannosyltransferase